MINNIRSRLFNILRGIVPVASEWGTAPTNLENCTDGNVDTVTGTGSKVVDGIAALGYLTFDLGRVKTVLVGAKVGLWSTASGVQLLFQASNDNITFSGVNVSHGVVYVTSTGERVGNAHTVVLTGRYIRLYFEARGAQTGYVKIYEVMAWELQI